MQKTDFIKAVAEQTNISQKEVKQIVEVALDVISQTLQRGEKITLTGFGTFKVRERKEREGINPQTRAKITIAATKTPGFSAGSSLRASVTSEGDPSKGDEP